jgi:Signal peptidase, peptidase S26
MSDRFPLRPLALVALSMLVAATLTLLLFRLSIIRGEIGDSRMQPYFAKGDAIWVDHLTPHFLDYARGEVVSVRLSRYFDHGTLMRVVALPGAQIIRPGSPTLDAEEFLLEALNPTEDSVLQIVPRADINGRVILRVRPLARFTWRPGLAASPSDSAAR